MKTWLLCALPLVACEASHADLAGTSQPIWGGATDDNSREANAVVYVDGCTGTLITPRLVLTAAHCLDPGTLPTVQLGNSRDGFGGDNAIHATRVLPFPGFRKTEPDVPHPPSLDAQLVWLERPVITQAKIRRPSLVPPSSFPAVGMAGWSTCGPNIEIPDPSVVTRQVVEWFEGSTAGGAPLALQSLDWDGAKLWKRDGTDVGVCFGDSGGPLYLEHGDLSREVIGVLSLLWYDGESKQAVAAAWADITVDPLRSWIVDNVLDSANGGHSAAWLAAHGKGADFWYGETDYTGACDAVRDPDCDGWYSEHDDQPGVYNPEQAETPAGPCAGLCSAPTLVSSQYYGSGSLGSAATCHETTFPVAGLACGGLVSPRSFSVNGQTVSCGGVTLPAPRAGGYCLQTTAGAQDWAWFQLW